MSDNKSLSPILPWKTKISLCIGTAISNFARRSDGTINRRLLNLFNAAFLRVPPRTLQGLKVSDITIDSNRNLWFRLFIPIDTPDESKLPILVYFHGGGFNTYSPDAAAFDGLCCRIAQKNPAIVVSVNYRLSPEHRVPAAYDDGFDTLKFFDSKDLDCLPTNADLSRCFLVGDSAGGNIAHHVARRYAENEAAFSVLKVIGLIAIQPFFGGEERTESEIRLKQLTTFERFDWNWKVFLPQGADRDHEAANVFGPKSIDISGLKRFPPTLVFTGGFDPLQDRAKIYHLGLTRSGIRARLIEYPNVVHGFYAFPELPEAVVLVTEIANFIHNNGEIQ